VRGLHYVMVPTVRLRHPDRKGSLWELKIFQTGFVKWCNKKLKHVVFYDTSERLGTPEDRFTFIFYFESEDDALLFKLFWA
jgi:hypothetical protein